MSSLDLEFDGRFDEEPAVQQLERRWFAVLSATRTLQAECATLFEALSLADAAWRRACGQLSEFEALRDAMEQRLSALYEPAARRVPRPMSAA